MMQPYYSEIVRERRAHATLRQIAPGAGIVVYTLFREAMEFYERAEKLQPPANDDAILRWNTCVRIIMENTVFSRTIGSRQQLISNKPVMNAA